MTAPRPAPEPVSWLPVQDQSTWCSSCGVHRATVGHPLCPTCLDERSKEARR